MRPSPSWRCRRGRCLGIALLAAYLSSVSELSLEDYLHKEIFGEYQAREIEPEPLEETGYEEFMRRYRKYLGGGIPGREWLSGFQPRKYGTGCPASI